MAKNLLAIIIIVLGCLVFSCDSSKQKKSNTNKVNVSDHKIDSIKTDYAKGFSVDYKNGYKIINIENAVDKNQKYILYQRGDKKPETKTGEIAIEVPVQKIICMSTTHIAFIEMIDECERITAVSDKKFVYSEKVRNLIKQGKITEVGFEQNLDIEHVITLEPDILMLYEVDNIKFIDYERYRKAGIKIIVNAEYTEHTPLGKAEWVKFVAMLFNKEDIANQKFKEIADEYNECLSLLEDIDTKPSVLVNTPWKDIWYMPGGDSYVANYLKDARADYFWKNSSSERILMLDFEAVLDECAENEFWINPGNAKSIDEMIQSDERHRFFTSLKSGNIYNNNKRISSGGGSDFWESGVVYPNIVLKDLIKIFHPDIIPDHELYYYQKLN